VVNGYGENTLVWELEETIPNSDVTYDVSIEHVIIDSAAQDFSYQIRIIDPSD
jgi:hypothetical protein